MIQRRHAWTALLTCSLAIAIQPAFALITGGQGNQPLDDPGWPEGAAAIINDPTRIAWWVGPPFGGGQWHCEYRGSARDFHIVVAGFAKMDGKAKRIVLHNGVGRSFWLNMNREPAKKEAAQMDWKLTVWESAGWERACKFPAQLRPGDLGDADKGPPARLDVYTGGNLDWAKVELPPGLEVVDDRLEAHGFTPADGNVLEGNVTALVTGRPLAARIRLERSEPKQKGGYRYSVTAEATADEKGHWVMKKAPDGGQRVIVEADGYVPRVAGFASLDDQPSWQSFKCGMSRAGEVSGRVVDEAGQPLADVTVRLSDVLVGVDQRYDTPDHYTATTGADGRFGFAAVPLGRATVSVHKPGYCRRGLGLPITTPTNDVALNMLKAARIQVTIDFGGKKPPAAYMVDIEPEGGSKVGTWGGTSTMNEKQQVIFKDAPPGRYVLKGHPNPSNERQYTEPQTIDLKGGQTVEITLKAK